MDGFQKMVGEKIKLSFVPPSTYFLGKGFQIVECGFRESESKVFSLWLGACVPDIENLSNDVGKRR